MTIPLDRTIRLALLCLMTALPARAASILDFEAAATGAEFAGDSAGMTAGPFLIDGIPTLFTTEAVLPGRILSASSFGLGIWSGPGDPDIASFNIGESWAVSADQGLVLLGVDFGGVQVEERMLIRSEGWIGLSDIHPASPSVSFHPPSGTFTLTDLAPADTDVFDLAALTGGRPLPLPAGTALVVGMTGSSFGPNDDVELSTLTFAGVPDLFDFGDAREPFPTLQAANGARHKILAGYSLGVSIDDEADGQPSADAGADGSDEDGIVLSSPMRLNVLPTPATIEATASAPGKLDAWVDFNQDGDWLDAGEKIVSNESLTAGVTAVSFTVEPDALLGCDAFARFRFSSSGRLSPTGVASDGEVEDYRLAILPDDHLDLFNRTISEDRVFMAAEWISAGGNLTTFPDLSILAPAKVVLHAADRVVFNNGVFVDSGAELTVITAPVLSCPP